MQKLSVLTFLANRVFSEEQLIKVLPVLMDVLRGDCLSEFQIVSGRTIQELLADGVLRDVKLVNSFFPCIRRLMESKDQEVLNTWADTMIAAIQVMSLDLLESEVVSNGVDDAENIF